MKTYGLIGSPVSHSLSPLMHNAAFRHLKIDAEYRLFELKEQELKPFLASLKVKAISGLNVTVPYKEQVIPYLDNLSAEAKLIGAANTIKVTDRLEGFNTDGAGFLQHVREDLEFNPQGKSIVLLGAGGAAKAVSAVLCKEKPKALNIFDIDKDKSNGLARHLKSNFPEVEIIASGSIAGLSVEKTDLLINATPIGMKETDPELIGQSLLHKGLLVYDLIYNPKETKLLKSALEKGCRVANGLGMLLYQAARSFQIWTDVLAPVEVMRQALKKGVEKL